jgi:hypothetical protein
VPVARPVWLLSSRQTNNLPIAFLDEPLDDVTAYDTEGTNYDRLILHTLPHSWSLPFRTLITVMLPRLSGPIRVTNILHGFPLFECGFDR